jgi:hypothetical protein
VTATARATGFQKEAHTTLPYQMGLEQDALSHVYLGRKERLTEVRGEVVKDIVI